MDLEDGNTIYVEATIHGKIHLYTADKPEIGFSVLTPAEARTLSKVLVRAADEAQPYRPAHTLGAVSVPEFARRLKVHQATVREWLKTGQIRSVKVSDTQQGRWLIPLSELTHLSGEE
jgi:excisionase family DNA binding protein